MNAQLKNSDSICLTKDTPKNMKMIESLDELKEEIMWISNKKKSRLSRKFAILFYTPKKFVTTFQNFLSAAEFLLQNL